MINQMQQVERIGLERFVQVQRRPPTEFAQQAEQVGAMAAGFALRACLAHAGDHVERSTVTVQESGTTLARLLARTMLPLSSV